MASPDSHSLRWSSGWHLLYLALVLCLSCDAEDLRYLHHQAWTTEEGLPQNSVHRILQTRDGFLWVATEGGVARFDGVGFKVFRRNNEPAFTSDDVCCFVEDRFGDLWIGTADGLLRDHAGHFQRFSEHEGLPSNSITSLSLSAEGKLVIQTAREAAMWDGAIFRSVPSQASVFLQNPFSTTLGLNGSTWSFSAKTVQVTHREFKRQWHFGQVPPGARIESLSIDRAGEAWVGTSSGLFVLNEASTTPAPIPALQGDAVLQTYEDREGNHWVGGETTGLHILRSLPFRAESALAGTSLTSVTQTSDGSLWAGTRDDGLRRLQNGKVDMPVRSSALSSPVILALAAGPDGSIWAGTPDGLNHIKNNRLAHIFTATDGLPDDYIRSLATDQDGSVWAGTRRGLAHIRGSQIDILTIADGLGGDLIGALLVAQPGSADRLWIGTSGGLSVLHRDGSIKTYTAKDGLPGTIVTALSQDASGTLWVATRGSLSRFDGSSFLRIASPRFDQEIEAMLADRSGFLWMRRLRGISRVLLSDLYRCGAICAPSITQYSLADGLPSDEMIAGGSPALWQTSSGELWFPTRRGIAVTDATHVRSSPVPPLVAIERFLVDESTLDAETSPDIPYGQSRFTIEYAGLSYIVPSEIRYRFMLEGFERDWTDAGARRSATYTNLAPGIYRFRVQAANNDGVWNESGAELRFRIVPPFYRRWWFVLLVLLLLTGLTIAIYRLRLRRLHKQFDAVLQERNRMAREIHDTLAQDFVGVSIQLDLVSHLLNQEDVTAAANQVQQTRKLVQNGLAEARQSIWELRANTAHDSLPARLTKVVERYTSPTLPIRLKITGIFRKLDIRLETEVLRIAQEALSNIQRHSAATKAAIELRYERDMLVLMVEDNGRGFALNQPSTQNGHYGLSGMRERAATIDSTLEIESQPGSGTRVFLTVPLTKGD